jgi:hypothetical protein
MITLNESELVLDDIDWLLANRDKFVINGTFRSLIWEQRLSHMIGARYVDQYGYDAMHDLLNRTEIKTTFSWHIPNQTIAFEGLKSKKGKCDHFLFYSDILKQAALIKHDDLFHPGVLYEYPSGALAFRVKVKQLTNNVFKKSPAMAARELWLDNLVPIV